MYIVGFENGKTFIIKDNGKIEEIKNREPQIIIVEKLTKEKLEYYNKMSIKILECKDNQDLCLSKVLKILFGRPKSCKFT
ncbi:hypothetical protein [Acidianus sp. HS-5]|uniref:hypothetical protein n=1 Tax=Acidianus sp. HS-5 TaxID=2886040 RepID=UPI001F270670|nr:hypothetical protein [Acidianus sp. HS-5]BDC19383.1 hypothetical protein HS5_22730 [Acidianus sp. HS-5]